MNQRLDEQGFKPRNWAWIAVKRSFSFLTKDSTKLDDRESDLASSRTAESQLK